MKAILAIVLVLITVVLLWYALWGREWLKSKPWAQGFFALIEPIEIALFKKSETILFARLKILTGLLLTLLTSLGTIDLTPVMPFVPEKYRTWVQAVFNLLPMLITLVGWMDERLRNKTTLPIEVVAVSDKTMAENPKVSDAVTAAVSSKQDAVTVIKEEKAAS